MSSSLVPVRLFFSDRPTGVPTGFCHAEGCAAEPAQPHTARTAVAQCVRLLITRARAGCSSSSTIFTAGRQPPAARAQQLATLRGPAGSHLLPLLCLNDRSICLWSKILCSCECDLLAMYMLQHATADARRAMTPT
jgi:hypothetical protein